MQVEQPKFRTKRLVTAIATALAISPLLVACGGGSSNSSDSTTYSLSANGGHAMTIGAGDGGEIRLNKDGGSGDLAILRTGKASASVSINEPTLSLGSNPLVISSNTTIGGAADGAPALGVSYYVDGTTLRDANNPDPETNALPVGTLYIHFNQYVYSYTGNTSEDIAYTGLDVAAGAILTLGLTNSSTSSPMFDDDVRNRGSITVVDAASVRGSIYLFANNYFGSGSINVSGSSSMPDAGTVEIDLTGGFYNTGPISAAGFNNPAGDGGSSRWMGIYAEGGPLVNSGVIDNRGGTGSDDGGTSNNYIDLYGYDMVNSATIYTNGGDGGVNGGYGGEVYFNASESYSDGSGGVIYNTGTVHAHGGNGGTSSGGNAGILYLYGNGGHIVNTASLQLQGGDGSTDAGTGGRLEIYSDQDGDTPAGDILISGNLNLNGGSSSGSGWGGDAGRLDIQTTNGGLPGTQRLALLGYPNIYLDGGSTDSGWAGYGGEVVLYGSGALDTENNPIAGGDVINQANVYARSGDSANGLAERGGAFIMVTSSETADIGMYIHNSGDIDLSSGQSHSTLSNISGGIISMLAVSGLTNTGNLTIKGGDNTGGGVGSTGGIITLWSIGPLSNTARLDVSGGQGADGGDAGFITLATVESDPELGGVTYGPGGVTTSGGAYAQGGNATGASGTGGTGGGIRYHSDFYGSGDPVVTTAYSGVQSISGGTGVTPGENGCLVVDGDTLVGPCPTLE